ncbi:MAG: serine/threonine protein kinase [Alphaproteobacteria bacterium]|nr:serine/threonine protein kinase [Alphaproteobacteria bacterium]
MELDLLDEARRAFEALVELPPDEREHALAALHDRAPTVASLVGELLAADQERFGALDTVDGITGVLHQAMGLERPDRIRDYEVLGELGRGGMGIVYEAQQPFPRRRVALKTLHPLQQGEAAREQFHSEVDAMARVLHPGIPQVYEAFEWQGLPVLVMERVDGTTLVDAARDRSPTERLRLMVEVARAVAHAHARGVVHRDLKPGNLMVERETGRAKVLDFGIAALVDERARSGGTLAYVAPEQLEGGAVDGRADVFGLGATCFEIMTDRTPLGPAEGMTVERALVAKATPPEMPPGLPRELAAVLRMAMAPRPEDRHPSAEAFADDLERVIEHRVPRALAGDPRTVARSAWRRGRRPFTAGLVAVTLVLLAVPVGGRVLDRRNATRRAQAADRDLAAALALPAPDDRGRALAAFVDDPSHDATPALGRAWLAMAEGLDDEEALHALAAAYAYATTPEVEQQALAHLARDMRRSRRWSALVATVDRLGDAADRELRAQQALATGDWERAAGLVDDDLAPLVRLFEHVRWDSVPLADGDIGPDGARWSVDGGSLRRHGPTGAVAQVIDIPWGGTRHLPPPITFVGDHVRVVTPWGGPLLDIASDGTQTLLPWDGSDWTLALHTVDGRTLVGVDPDHGGIIAVGPDGAAPYDDHLIGTGGYVQDIRTGDLDGDGRDEVVYGVRGWGLRDLRVRNEATGALATYRMTLRSLDVARTPQGPRVVAVGVDPSLKPHADEAYAALPFLVTLALVDDTLVELARTPLAYRASRVHAADLDGDGFDEVVLSRHEVQMSLGRLAPDGSWHGFLVPWVWPHRAGDLDPAHAGEELWIVDRQGRTGVLGAAEDVPLQLDADPLPGVQLDVPVDAAPRVARRIQRIGVLAELGLLPEATRLLTSLGESHPALARSAFAQGIELTRSFPERVALDRPDPAEVARLDLARRLVRLGDPVPQVALDALWESHAWADLPADARPDWSAASQLALSEGLPAATDVMRPGSVAWDPVQGRLNLDTMTGDGDVLAFRIERADDRVDLVADLRWIEQDFGAKLHLSLAAGDGALGLETMHAGGSPVATRRNTVVCGPRGSAFRDLGRSAGPRLSGPVRVRISWMRDDDVVSLRCQLGETVATWTGPFTPATDVEGLFVHRADTDGAAGRVLFGIDRVELRGGRFVDAPTPPLRRLSTAEPTAPGDLATLSDAELSRLLRTRPASSLAAVRAAVPDRFASLAPPLLLLQLEDGKADTQHLLTHDALADLPLHSDALRTLVTRRAEALIAEGRLAEARHTVDRLQQRDDALVGSLLSARLYAASGDLEAARRDVAHILATSRTPELALIEIHADPLLAPLAARSLPPGLEPP